MRILVWDLPVRVGHWLLAGSFAVAFLTSESESYRHVHIAAGTMMATLIGFRLIWGLVGSVHARFGSFVRRPGEVLAYLKGLALLQPRHWTGHNPAGGYAILGMLALGLSAAASGFVLYQWDAHWAEEVHEFMAFGMLSIVLLHVAGVVVGSLLHRENLVRAMFSGYKKGAPGEALSSRHGLAAALLVLLSVLAALASLD